MTTLSTKDCIPSKKLGNVISSGFIQHWRKRVSKLFLIAVSFSLMLIMYMLFEPYWVEEKKYIIEDSDIPSTFNGMKIVFLTDIHHGIFYSESRIHNLVNNVNKIGADIILLGGDYVDGNPRFIVPCFNALNKLKAVYGVYGVLGNHDHWQGADSCRNAMRMAGILSIDNGAYWINNVGMRIRIGGVGDHCEDKQYLNRTIDGVSQSDFVILVTHSPDYAMDIKTDKVDYILSGHTHGGQITLFGIYAPKVPSRYKQKFRTGLVPVKNSKVIISNGIGTVNLPLRFFARPQIITMELRTGEKENHQR